MDTDDALLASDLAGRAGHLLLRIRAQDMDPRALGRAGDQGANEFLLARLAELRQATPCCPRSRPTTPPG
jgi:hypothetical protein